MPGNIVGCFIFLALYYLLPPSIYNYVGVIGGIGVGLSATYGCQAVFNTFGALAIATSAYGLKSAVGLRVAQNVFGVVFALLFCLILQRIFAAGSALRAEQTAVLCKCTEQLFLFCTYCKPFL